MELEATLLELETLLLSPEARHDAATLERLLCAEFHEFGSSGRRYSREEVIASLLASRSKESWMIAEFQMHPLAPDVALVTYRAARQAECTSVSDSHDTSYSLRSSIWVRRKEGWQMLFHQGTAAPSSVL